MADAAVVNFSEAAARLGVHRTTVADLARLLRLETVRHPVPNAKGLPAAEFARLAAVLADAGRTAAVAS